MEREGGQETRVWERLSRPREQARGMGMEGLGAKGVVGSGFAGASKHRNVD